jgi:hypothetical protein
MASYLSQNRNMYNTQQYGQRQSPPKQVRYQISPPNSSSANSPSIERHYNLQPSHLTNLLKQEPQYYRPSSQQQPYNARYGTESSSSKPAEASEENKSENDKENSSAQQEQETAKTVTTYIKPSRTTNKTSNFTNLLIYIINMIIFALGFVLLILGILYLTTHSYKFSFTTFSIDLMAGFFIAIGAILITMALAGVLASNKIIDNPMILLGYSGILLFFFLILFILGIVGLSLRANNDLFNQTRDNMFSIIRSFDERNPYKHETKKFNWVQSKFQCCGVDGYADFKSLYVYRGNYMPVRYFDQWQYENKYPYIDDVPDSCCVNSNPNCGKQINVFGRDRSSVIHTKGCLSLYYKYFNVDVKFTCVIALIIAGILLFASMLLALAFTLVRKDDSSYYRKRGVDDPTRSNLLKN